MNVDLEGEKRLTTLYVITVKKTNREINQKTFMNGFHVKI